MFKSLTSGGLACASVLALAPPAQAMEICRDRHSLTALLESEHKEHHQASGLQASYQLLELWVSEETGSWSILVTRPDGQSCIVASGSAWTPQDPAPKGSLS